MINTLITPRMATINETAEIVGLAKHYIRQLALQGKIKHVRAGKKILINVDRFIEYLNECPEDDAREASINKFGITPIKI
jgi:excisionase family DNA binding protein